MGVAVGVVKVRGGLRLRKSATRFITNWNRYYKKKCEKVRHGLLQIGISIINCDDYYKLRQYRACKQAT